jgi:diguanylate cyclase (GGDEF)-like protein
VILLDLDRFKVVNETLGHASGDQLLVAVGQRLAASVRPGDVVARFAGDEFGVVLASVSGPGEARRAADRIRANLEAPFDVDGREWFVAAQMGIAVGRPQASTAADLLHEAEIALVRAKADPAVDLAIFEPAMSGATLARVDLENDLRRALERNELRVHYQPLVDLGTDRVMGVEALVRWEHPQRGLVSPASFIPLAEQSGLIVPLGDWVLETACRQARAWREQDPTSNLVLSVNLSGRQFGHPDLLGAVLAILDRTGLPPSALELEITESVAMEESEATMRTLRALRDVGVRLVLDDFGTGYSSLAYLKRLPLDSIKLDRAFIADLGVHDANIPIVSAVVALAHGLGIDVVAEGIETVEQRVLLESLGCDRGQGFLYAPPLPAEAAAAYLSRDRDAAA